MLTFILLVISFLWYPGWLLPFLRASWNSFRAGFGYSAHDILGRLWPQLGSTLGWVLTAFLIVGLAYEWRAVRRANFDRFLWAICLTIAISPLLGFPVEMDQLAPLMLPVMLVIIIARERWLKLGNGIAFLVLLFFFGVPWLLFTQGVPQAIPLTRVDEILFLFWPIFTVIGLYWMRWWMVRPPRTWLDEFCKIKIIYMNWRIYTILFFLGLAIASGVASLQELPGYLDSDYYFVGGLQLVEGKGFTEPFLWNYLDDPAGLPHPSHTYWYRFHRSWRRSVCL